jgi:phosphatidylserine/phosphatidylglycerophosphate/cardiolipin synthase-like enzyme
LDRWNDHPLSVNFNPIPRGGLLGDMNEYFHGRQSSSHVWNPTDADDLEVRVGRTYPNSTKHALYGPKGPHDFAPQGERSAKALVLNAILQSKRFIYIEEQYLTDMSISDALKAALPHLEKLIILITASSQIVEEQLQPYLRRRRFIENLTGGAQPPNGKVIVCRNVNRYVHSKTFIFDDKFAIIGSANLTRRGYTHDSEQNVGIFDTNKKEGFFFAHFLRMHLWAKHLGMRPNDLVFPLDNIEFWEKPEKNPKGNIARYMLNFPDDLNPQAPKHDKYSEPLDVCADEDVLNMLIWDIGLDPDGS